MFTKNVKTYFDQADPAGILFFGEIITMAIRLIEDFLAQSDLSWEGWFNNTYWIVPIRHAQADFLQPMKAGQIYQAHTEIVSTTKHSITFATNFSYKQQILTSVKTVHVFVSKESNEKIAVPQDVLDKLKIKQDK